MASLFRFIRSAFVTVFFATILMLGFLYFSASKSDRENHIVVPIQAVQSKLEPPLGVGLGSPAVQEVVARGLTASPGAIVCPDIGRVSILFHLYATHWEESMQDSLTQGKSRPARGEAAAPDPAAYGCAMVPADTPMLMQEVQGAPNVSVKLKDSSIIKGVTLPGMIGYSPSTPPHPEDPAGSPQAP